MYAGASGDDDENAEWGMIGFGSARNTRNVTSDLFCEVASKSKRQHRTRKKKN